MEYGSPEDLHELAEEIGRNIGLTTWANTNKDKHQQVCYVTARGVEVLNLEIWFDGESYQFNGLNNATLEAAVAEACARHSGHFRK